jgi:hypothetical protein
MNISVAPVPHSLQALLGGLATITREVAEQLENTSSGVGQDLMKLEWSGDAVVKLQDFDKMCQQLTGVSNVLRRCSDLIANCDAAPPELLDSIVAEVPMRQLRHRMQDALARPGSARIVVEEDAVF